MDRNRGNHSKVVRKQASFGQVSWKQAQSCQKERSIRTGFGENATKLSESSRKAVRKQLKLGQALRKQSKSCQKATVIGTGFEEIVANLSESKGDWDKFWGNSHNAVRKHAPFGQKLKQPQQSCQKERIGLTGYRQHSLSESSFFRASNQLYVDKGSANS